MNINSFKPTLRDTDRIDIVAYIRGIERIITNTKQFPFRNCLNCQQFAEATELCKRWNSRPPARVIAYGCEEHQDIEGVPF